MVRGRYFEPVNFWVVKFSNEKKIGELCDEFSEGTKEGCGVSDALVAGF